MKAVVLLSGGLDSAANLALSCKRGEPPALAVTFDYSQKAAVPEAIAAKALCEFFDVPHKVVDLKFLGSLGGNALTHSDALLPKISSRDLDTFEIASETAKAVWVPNRNGVFIQVAAAYAESMGAEAVLVGFNREEAMTFPDNSTAFIEASNKSLKFSTLNAVRVICHTDRLSKREIVQKLKDEVPDFPFHLIWSCYLGRNEPCGECESCKRFRRAIFEGGAQ